jgi:hypothetical protein
MAAPTFYNQGDQDIYNSGQHFVPQEKYRLGYTPPAAPEVIAPVPGGIINTNAFNNSGGNDGFSVYNPDPNSIVNRTYNPRPYYDATYEDTFGTNLGDPEALTATGARFAEPNTKMQGLMGMMPGAGIARFLGNQIGPYIPPNRRAIMENQLSGQGIMVNDIGQIVQGDGAYDTAGNVMAGYNANKMTAKTFDDRIEMADNKMSAENKGARIKALKEAKAAWEKATGRSDTIYNFEEEEKKKNKKNTVINRFITKKKETKAVKKAEAAQAEIDRKADIQRIQSRLDDTGVTGSNYNQAANERGGGGGNTATNSQGQTAREATYDGNKNTGTNQSYSQHYADGGRAGYFFGGRVNYKAGGRTDAGPNRTTASKVGVGQINESGQKVSGGNFNNSNDGGNDTKQPALLVKKVDTIDTSGLKSKSPEINIDYTDPRNYASLKGNIYNTNILDNDDINVDGTLSGEIGPVSYNTNFTDQGITGTNLTAGNFNADIDANKNYSLGYANNYNGIDYGAKYDNNGNLMFSAGVNFKNGGLAGLL